MAETKKTNEEIIEAYKNMNNQARLRFALGLISSKETVEYLDHNDDWLAENNQMPLKPAENQDTSTAV